MGGKISVESEVGKGSTFKIELEAPVSENLQKEKCPDLNKTARSDIAELIDFS